MALPEGKKYCKHCGEIIDEDSSASASVMQEGRVRRRHNHFLDFILICCTGGLWIIWMLLRPKYY